MKKRLDTGTKFGKCHYASANTLFSGTSLVFAVLILYKYAMRVDTVGQEEWACLLACLALRVFSLIQNDRSFDRRYLRLVFIIDIFSSSINVGYFVKTTQAIISYTINSLNVSHARTHARTHTHTH